MIDCHIENSGIEMLAESLDENKNLTELELSDPEMEWQDERKILLNTIDEKLERNRCNRSSNDVLELNTIERWDAFSNILSIVPTSTSHGIHHSYHAVQIANDNSQSNQNNGAKKIKLE